MGRKRKNLSCEVGGQAVLEGVMMKNKDDYAIAVRRADGGVEVEVDFYKGWLCGTPVRKIPLVRGIFNFADAMALGIRTLNYSASLYADDGGEPTAFDRFLERVFGGRAEKVLMGFTTLIAFLFAIGIFILAPFYLSDWLRGHIAETGLVPVIEGVFRISIFLIYVAAIGLIGDIRRLYRYHGAEHKCINCIEAGRPLTRHDVMRSSRLHRRCGTSFMFFVIFLSIVVFFFISADSIWARVGLRLALIPAIAAVAYEIIRWAGRSNFFLVTLLSAPGMLIQRLTTREPDEEMVEVAMTALEAVFDWKEYLREAFGYEVDDEWMAEPEPSASAEAV